MGRQTSNYWNSIVYNFRRNSPKFNFRDYFRGDDSFFIELISNSNKEIYK